MNVVHRLSLAAGLLFSAQSVFAHDPALHAAEAAAARNGPNCAALAGMDLSALDRNDPLVRALHMKCPTAGAPAAGRAPADHGAMHGTMPGMVHPGHGD